MIVPLSADQEPLAILGYGDDDRWYVLGVETEDPALVLAVMLGFREAFVTDHVPTA